MIPIVYPVDSDMKNYKHHRYRKADRDNSGIRKHIADANSETQKIDNEFIFTYCVDSNYHTEEIYNYDHHESKIDKYI